MRRERAASPDRWHGGGLAALTAVPASAENIKPESGTYWGRSKAIPKNETRDRRVKLKVAESRRRLDVLGPHERCPIGSIGFNPFPQFFGRIDGLKVSRKGKFDGKRRYQVRIEGARAGGGVVLDLVLDWKIEVSGAFVKARKAKGTIAFEMRHRLEDHAHPGAGWDPPGADGPMEFKTCGKRSGDWWATRREVWFPPADWVPEGEPAR